MSYDPSNSPSRSSSYAGGQAIDAGLQSYMRSIYNTMSLGLVITGGVAFGVSSMPDFMHFLFGTAMGWLFMLIVPLIVIFVGFSPARVARQSAQQLKTTFFVYSVLMGLMFSSIFLIYTGESIARVFFITAATFGGTSLFGYTTRRDLTGMGSFMVMGLFGIIIASFVNFFMHSAMVQFVVSVAGVIIFTGLTAWETQGLKSVYRSGDDVSNSKMAILGALNLYMSFINLFQFMLQLMGDRR